MTCAEALQAILEADPATLLGRGDDGLARHIRECSECRGMAQTVLETEESLGDALVAAVPAPPLDVLIDRVLPQPSKSKPFRFRPKAFGLGLLPLAAAAAMVGLFLGTDPQIPGNPYSPSPEAPGLGLEVPEGQNVAVLATKDPNITVLWFF